MQRQAWIGWMAGVAIGFSAGNLGMAQIPGHIAPENETLILRVYDYAHANSEELMQAEAETGRILATAHISGRWVDCATNHAELQRAPDCQPRPRRAAALVVLLPAAMANRMKDGQDALGSAIGAPDGFGRAYIFYDRVHAISGGNTASFAALLGRVMAHEVGHLLLGPAHSRTGIMQGAWSDRQLSSTAGSDLVFSAGQAQRAAKCFSWQPMQADAQTETASRAGN